jgi:MinD-like ATPase involved in chromosome partitioning or flagellar assembly
VELNRNSPLRSGVLRRPGGANRSVARTGYPEPEPTAPAARPQPQPVAEPVPTASPEPRPNHPQWTYGWRRAVQVVIAGLIRPGAADAMNGEHELVARARSRPRQPRIIAVVAGKGGVGASTTASATAMVLAALRHDSTALLDPRHGTGSLGMRLAGRPAPTIEQLITATPLRINGSLDVVDGAPWHSPVTATRLAAALDALRDSHALTIADVGNHPDDNTRLILGRADQVVVVASTTRDAIESTRVALSRIRSVAPVLLSTVVVAVPSVASRTGRGDPARLAAELLAAEPAVPGWRVVPVPFDPALMRGGAIALREVRSATRTAFLRLAGLIADPGAPSEV